MSDSFDVFSGCFRGTGFAFLPSTILRTSNTTRNQNNVQGKYLYSSIDSHTLVELQLWHMTGSLGCQPLPDCQ